MLDYQYLWNGILHNLCCLNVQVDQDNDKAISLYESEYFYFEMI